MLSPSRRTEAGHRLYTAADVVRLQQITSLRHLDFNLEEIRDCLDRTAFPLRRVIELHLSRLGEQIELQRRVLDLLEAIATRLNTAEEVSAEELVETVTEVIGMSESASSRPGAGLAGRLVLHGANASPVCSRGINNTWTG